MLIHKLSYSPASLVNCDGFASKQELAMHLLEQQHGQIGWTEPSWGVTITVVRKVCAEYILCMYLAYFEILLRERDSRLASHTSRSPVHTSTSSGDC